MSSNDQTSLAWVCEQFPQRVQRLLASLNLDLPILSAVQAAVATADWPRTGSALLDYYVHGQSGAWLRHTVVPPGADTVPEAEAIVHDRHDGVCVPRLPSGGLNWAYAPPGDEHWAHFLNRHEHMRVVLQAYFDTGNREYARCLDAQICDWTTVTDCSSKSGSEFPWGNSLDVGHRGQVWPALFYGLQHESEFSPAARLLMLCQVLDHALYLRSRHSHGSNWVMTELTGLASIACAWPEFRDAPEWLEYATRVLTEEACQQIYPDGVQKELTSHYQYCLLSHLEFFVQTVRSAGHELPPSLSQALEKMWNYLAWTLTPDGYIPMNSDSDHWEIRNKVIAAANRYGGHPEWVHIATNGQQGRRPDALPSVYFPWAGQLVMRSDWDADAHWAFFDIGPWGVLHQHNDALHLSVSAYGRDLLVDSGRYTYENYLAESGTWRSYFVNSAAHNVVLVDGLVQADGPTTAEQPEENGHAAITPEYDYAQGTFAGGFTDVATASARLKSYLWRQGTLPEVDHGVRHTRGVLYLRGVGWVVVDRIETDCPRRISPLWHFHPDCTVAREDQVVMTVDEGVGNLCIQPLGPVAWEINFVSGREGPESQGWYSAEFGRKVPSTCISYSTDIARTTTVAWLLLPARGRVLPAQVYSLEAPDGAIHVKVELTDGNRWEIAIRLDASVPLCLRGNSDIAGYCAIRRY